MTRATTRKKESSNKRQRDRRNIKLSAASHTSEHNRPTTTSSSTVPSLQTTTPSSRPQTSASQVHAAGAQPAAQYAARSPTTRHCSQSAADVLPVHSSLSKVNSSTLRSCVPAKRRPHALVLTTVTTIAPTCLYPIAPGLDRVPGGGCRRRNQLAVRDRSCLPYTHAHPPLRQQKLFTQHRVPPPLPWSRGTFLPSRTLSDSLARNSSMTWGW